MANIFRKVSSYTYRELGESANRLANSLIDLGLKKGDRVAVQTGTGVGHVVTLLAVAQAGMALTPIDRTNMADEIAYLIADSGARAHGCGCGHIYEQD